MIASSITVTYRPALATDKFTIGIIIWRDNKVIEDNRRWNNTFKDACDYVKHEIQNMQEVYGHSPARIGFMINPNQLMGNPDGVMIRVVTDIWDEAEMALVRLWLG